MGITIAMIEIGTNADAGVDSEAAPSSILLQRARSIAAEHATLSAQNAESYDVSVAKRVGELTSTASIVKEWEDAQIVRT